METGKSLHCYKDLYYNPAAIKGKNYQVVWMDDEELIIRNEQDDTHTFSRKEGSEHDFRRWFFLVDSEYKFNFIGRN